MPREMANFETASTASYNLASSPSLLQGHIQLAESEIDFSPFSNGAQTMFESDSAMEFFDPATGSTKAETGEWPMEVATPSFPL